MEIGPFDAKVGSDRFSTSDEVLVALSSLRNILLEFSRDTLWEADSDSGIRESTEAEVAGLLRELERLDGRIN
jgi:hypothetical protein